MLCTSNSSRGGGALPIWIPARSAAGISVSASGWDSEALEYPHVFDHAGARYLLYNGNGYGKTGFGLALLEAA